jgi:ADP-ribose pyrophosphatase
MIKDEHISSEVVFDGEILKVKVDTLAYDRDRTVTREVVEAGSTVVILPIDSERNVLLVRQFRYPIGMTLLEAPAGRVEIGETSIEAAQRELREEIGYASRDIREMGSFWISPGYCTEYMHAYLAKDLVPGKLQPDDDEDIVVERFPLEDAWDMVKSGDIQDVKTIAAMSMSGEITNN